VSKLIFSEFSKRFSREPQGREALPQDLSVAETQLQYTFPASYREYLLEHGATFSPDILDLVVEIGLDIPDIQEFILVTELKSANEMYWAGGMPTEYIAFASDCMGNMFCFNRQAKNSDIVHMFDHDSCAMESLEISFPLLLNSYVEASNA